MISVAIPFVRINASQNPNVSVASNGDPAEPYFRAMTVAFASLRRWNPDTGLEFISNAEPPMKYQDVFKRLGVKIRIVPFRHRPPEGFSERFTASLYLLDALSELSQTTLLMDPDVLCISDLEKMMQEAAGKFGALRMDFAPTENINGLTRQEAGVLHGQLGKPESCPIHYGGEVYLIPIEHLDQLLGRVEQAWSFTLSQYESGRPKFTTEEHILSFALRDLPLLDLENYVQRIWTTHRYRRVSGDEHKLTLWHLPAEKDRGFHKIFPDALDGDSWFWKATRDDFISISGRAMGLHHRPAFRVVLDNVGRAVRALEDSMKILKAKASR
jgi:hypothetical protein